MQEISLKIDDKEYLLNNNSQKYDRAVHKAGIGASNEEILAFYDSFGGLIKDQEGNKIDNGFFWNSYLRWKEEQPKYIKIIEDREKILEEGERRIIEIGITNLDHKRAFLGTLMTIAAAIVAGLFIFTNTGTSHPCLNFLAMLSGTGLALFIVFSAVYLIMILSQESRQIDERLQFIRDSRKDFIEKVGKEITNIDSYERFREESYGKEKGLTKPLKSSNEIWFILVTCLFVLSTTVLIVMFILVSI